MMVPGHYTLMLSGVTDDGNHVIQKVWYLSKDAYERLIKGLPSPHINGMTSTDSLERHGDEVMKTIGTVVLPQTFQDGNESHGA